MAFLSTSTLARDQRFQPVLVADIVPVVLYVTVDHSDCTCEEICRLLAAVVFLEFRPLIWRCLYSTYLSSEW